MDTYLAPQHSVVRLARVPNPPTHILLPAPNRYRSVTSPFGNHATVFLGLTQKTCNKETQTVPETRPIVPVRSPTRTAAPAPFPVPPRSPVTPPLLPRSPSSLSSRSLPRSPTTRTQITRSPASRSAPRSPTSINAVLSHSGNSPPRPVRTFPVTNGASPLRQTTPVTSSPTSVVTQQNVSLSQGRTGPRVFNDYVGSPTVASLTESSQNNSAQQSTDEPHLHRHFIQAKTVSLLQPKKNLVVDSSDDSTIRSASAKALDACAKTDKKDVHSAKDSIMCARCGRCKCAACKETRDLPSTWICKKRIHVSADTIVECCSCLVCVKSVFYHCGQDFVSDDDDNSCVDEPCACCSRPHAVKRWICMALMSLCLPCLCLYWPARGCVSVCKACYNKSTRRGCRCKNKEPASRRSLLEPDSSST